MKVLISGCSFSVTNYYESGLDEEKMWVWHPFNERKIINLLIPESYDFETEVFIDNKAWSGAGNKYIADSIILSCAEYNPDLIMVMWSGPERLDFPIRKEFYADSSLITYSRSDNIRYMISGGPHSSLYSNIDLLAENLFKNLYIHTSPLELNIMTLLEIVKLQNFLVNLKIPFYFMSFCNFWNIDNLPNSTFSMVGYKDHSQIQKLTAMIDFDRWIFENENKDGYYEVAKKMNCFKPDKFHPGFEASRIWGQIVKDRLIKDKIL